VVNRERGYTLLEIVVSLALFGVFLLIITQLTREMTGYERRLPINFMAHPQVGAVLARMRRDVSDTTAPYYPDSYGTYTQSKKTLILYSLQSTGNAVTVVWDFTTPGEAHRLAYSVGSLTSDWVARGVPPSFTITDFPIDGHPDSVRVQARDQKGILAIDQLFQPRPHS